MGMMNSTKDRGRTYFNMSGLVFILLVIGVTFSPLVAAVLGLVTGLALWAKKKEMFTTRELMNRVGSLLIVGVVFCIYGIALFSATAFMLGIFIFGFGLLLLDY